MSKKIKKLRDNLDEIFKDWRDNETNREEQYAFHPENVSISYMHKLAFSYDLAINIYDYGELKILIFKCKFD